MKLNGILIIRIECVTFPEVIFRVKIARESDGRADIMKVLSQCENRLGLPSAVNARREVRLVTVQFKVLAQKLLKQLDGTRIKTRDFV